MSNRPSEADQFHGATLSYIEELMLVEDLGEDWDGCHHHDPLALRAIEDSFYHALSGKNGPPCSDASLNPCSGGSADSITLNWSESVLRFHEGEEEAMKFLPLQNHLNHIDLSCSRKSSPPNPSNGDEVSELFDRLFLESSDKNRAPLKRSVAAGTVERRKTKVAVVVELEKLLLSCARAVAADDRGTANGLLTRVRDISSPFGDGVERCAHYFANGLEARLGPASPQARYAPSPDALTSPSDLMKVYKTMVSVCPFKTINFRLAMHHILKLAQAAKTLHIIDFGIVHGLRWAIVIKSLSALPGGPPKLRITGVDFHQLKPRMSEETMRRLARYCERFNVPFEYNSIVSKDWEKIRVEDLMIDRNEAIAVTCMLQFEKLLDEVHGMNCPRTRVLNLIREVNPDIFIHSFMNGFFSMPMFFSRFREALHYYSALFDMHDTVLERESEARMLVEREYLGWAVLDVIAFEGAERMLRPETYRQWQLRSARAGFRQLPLDKELMNELRRTMRDEYHEDYMVMEDGNCLLLGWKGRCLIADCYWTASSPS